LTDAESETAISENGSPPLGHAGDPTAPMPKLARVKQRFDSAQIRDIPGRLAETFGVHAQSVLRPGMRVAITVGSRGIANIQEIARAVVEEVRRLDAEVFIVSAMGSHGGATEAGQRLVLAGYGITEESVGCPISCTMDTVHLGDTPEGFRVHVDRAAFESDAIVLLNRVKPHSILSGELGSGLMKMAAIGLGNRAGADSIHRAGVERHLLSAARMVLQLAPVHLGVAIVENALDQTWMIETVPKGELESRDKQLLALARTLLPTVPFDPIDVLVVEYMGKNFSGAGMDPNVIGMHRRVGGSAERDIHTIVALDLSAESQGNAVGVGMADIITDELRHKINWDVTYLNAFTSGFFSGVKLPVACRTQRDAVQLAMQSYDPHRARVVQISDTAHLEYMQVSEPLLNELHLYPNLELSGDLTHMAFKDS